MTLIEYPDLEQGTEEWLAARRGIVTASVVGQLLTVGAPGPRAYPCLDCEAPADASCVSKAKRKDGEPNTIKTFHPQRIETAANNRHDAPPVIEVADNDTSRALTALLVAERITGWSDPTYYSADMQRGHDVEPIARDWYTERFDLTGGHVSELGFMVRVFDDFKIGYSPDGLVGDDGLIEIKAPRMKSHLLTHIEGKVPLAHMAQIQAGLLVADRQWCDFISFYAGMPPFIKRVHRDEKWGAVIVKAVEQFEERAAEMQAHYSNATTGLPQTERLLIDMEIF